MTLKKSIEIYIKHAGNKNTLANLKANFFKSINLWLIEDDIKK